MDEMEEYMFDLRGYTIIPEALDPDHIAAMNAWIDALPPLEPDKTQPIAPPEADAQWIGNVYTQAYGRVDGVNLQDIIEAGDIFERLIDHPAWIDRVRHYIGPSAKPYIHEIFVNVRGPSGYIWPHSGGHGISHNEQTGRQRGEWVCYMLSLLVPLNDVGPGDGATVIIPGSHKSDIEHPQTRDDDARVRMPTEELEGAMELHLKAGDAVLHGSAKRSNPGQRRMVAIRYVPATIAHRFGYKPSDELVSRLTPERLGIVQPNKPHKRPK